jgi:hypothetical protein
MATTTAPTGFGRAIWNAVKGAHQTHGTGLVAVSAYGQGATQSDGAFEIPIFVAPKLTEGGSWKLESAKLFIPDTSVSIVAGSGSHKWEFKLRLYENAAASDLGVSVISNESGAITVDRAYDLSVAGPENATPKKVFLEDGNAIVLAGTVTGTGKGTGSSGNLDLNGQTFVVTAYFRQTPPGR